MDADRYKLRKPCICGCEEGNVRETNGQNVVKCLECGRWQYNAPKSETGEPQRHVKTREEIKPKQRSRIVVRANGVCEICRDREEILHVGHMLSIDQGRKLGFTDEELNADENLCAMCESCNIGLFEETLPLRLAYEILLARIRLNGGSA